ncbi:FAD-binding domain-containing protein [Dendrothele bispora CBS 962.96]|uniref:FAD-binding domain-containing protein n=1 Tax=Dendrothele bispora (strain CBS 962.96) TaxID=1314807 RepID=A0A4S8MD48_DENBC|nr:FAD-binding domain-containing protein [Dendrothele bispora CBS 962.96]
MTYSPYFVPEGGNVSYPAITLGAGVPFEDLYKFADVNNVTVVGGYAQTIAASGGWVMGGGHSILSPVFGLGVDRVLQFRIVTPDGRIRVVNEFQNPDLFWALRGGGGGTFGVVLESTMLVEPQMKLQVASIHFTQTRQNAGSFLEILVEQALKWSQEGWGGHMSPSGLINVNPLLTLEQAKQSMQPAVDFALSQNGTVVIEELPSWQAFFLKYVLAAESAVGVPAILGSRLIPAQNFASDDGKASLVKIFTTMFNEFNISINAVVGTPFLFNSTEGATSVTPAWRKSIWHMGFHGVWTYNATVEDIRSQYELVSHINQMLRDITPGSGAYFNEGDVHEPDHEQSFWGDNYPALLDIKRKYDPYGLLDCWQCVGWKGPEDERYACYLYLVAFASTQVHATPEQWTALGRDLGGRLHTALPFSSPCFSTVNGVDVGRNETECAVIRQGYTSPLFISPLFSPRMFPHWETCQRSSQKCLLDSIQPNNSAAWEGMDCEQGGVSPRYIDVQSAEDVQIAFRFAQETGVMLSIKASGHDYKGRSGAPGSLGLWAHKKPR